MAADRPILLALDGEPHTDAAVSWALELADKLGTPITAIHVQDHYLKQFHNDIYAQGREEYLEHLDHCLASTAADVIARFEAAAEKTSVYWSVKVRAGDPVDELMAELDAQEYSMIVLGQKNRHGLAAWRSRNLPSKLVSKSIAVPLLIVPELIAHPPDL